MMPQQMISTLLLVLLGLVGNAFGLVARAGGHPVLPRGPCSHTTNGAGIASAICSYPTDIPPSAQFGGHSSSLSHSPLVSQLSTSWTPVTEIYTTTNLDVITPTSRTGTYTDLSTQVTTATLAFNTATQTMVEIVGYSTIQTYTTTFLAPDSSSTYSTVQTVTTTSAELLVPSVDTLTLTGTLPPSVQSFPTMSVQNRGLAGRPLHTETSAGPTGVLPTLTSKHVPPHTNATATTLAPSPSSGPDSSIEAESVKEHTRSSSTEAFTFTVTNTYFITPTSEHKHKTTSQWEDPSTTWLSASPTIWISTHHQSNTTTYNASAVLHATTATMLTFDTSSTMAYTTSVEGGVTVPAKVTGSASPSSTSGSSVIFNGLVLHVALAVLAIGLCVFV